MRITKTDYSPLDVLCELIHARTYTLQDTKDYFQHERSSHLWLTEKWADKLEIVLSYFRRNGTEVCEQQHIRDNGVDVRMTFEYAGQSSSIGFQIKSNKEAADDSKKAKTSESMVATLKRQAFEAKNRAGIDQWWVVLAFDRATYAKKVQAINAELLGGADDEFAIRVIDPRSVMSFLSLPDEEIDALCTLMLCEDDEILLAAQQEAAGLSWCTVDLLLNHLGNALNGECVIAEHRAFDFSTRDDWTADEMTQALSTLQDRSFLTFYTGDLEYRVDPSAFPALCALYFEGRVRLNLQHRAALEFVWRLLRQ